MSRYIYQNHDNFLLEVDFPDAIRKMIVDTETGNMFPESVENSHYSEYLRWVEDGNPPAE